MKTYTITVVLVKKTYPKQRQKQKNRIWKLKTLDKEHLDENNHHKKEKASNKTQRDLDMFLQDIEEEPDMRQHIDLFRNEEVIEKLKKKDKIPNEDKETKKGDEVESDKLCNIKKKKIEETKGLENEDEEDSVEEDFPHIKVDDLKSIGQQLASLDIQDDEDDEEEEENVKA